MGVGEIVHRNKIRVGAAVAASALVGSLLAVPVSVGASTPAAAAGMPLKPYAAGAVQIDPAALADAGQVEVTVDPVDGLRATTVRVSGTGDATVTGGGSAGVPAGPSIEVAAVTIAESSDGSDPAAAAVADATGTTVTATLTGTTADGTTRSTSDTVWVDHFAGRTLVSESGEQDLRLQRVTALVDAGVLGSDEAEALRDEVRGGTESTESVTEAGCTGPNLCVTGTVQWRDSAGGLHPVDRAPVQIRDEEAGPDQVVATTTTDGNGLFNATIDNVDGDATGRDVYVRVLADGPGFTIDQFIQSNTTTDVADGAKVVTNFATNNTADNNTAFGVHASLVYAGDEIVLQNGALFDEVPVVFPDPDGSFYDGNALHILALDRWDWDVSLHEYGHFVADQLNIENNPGGFHTGSANLSDLRGSKAIGAPLAWGEGWPTFFAVSTLRERAADEGIPNIGDTKYQDTEDQVITDDLESTHTLGEDNEVTNMAILWDLYDSESDNRDQISLGAEAIWDTLDEGDPTTLSEAYELFSPDRAVEGANCVFSQMNVSPKIAGQSTTVTAARPTITWRRGNGGTHPNNRFSVKFRSAEGDLLLAGPTVRGNTFRPSRAQWDAILAGAQGTVNISVVGRQVDAPATGPYRSCTRSYTVD